ncbi:MAG: amino acid ABC transporter permease [Nevskiales bacterium]
MVRRPSLRARRLQWLLLAIVVAVAWYLGSMAAANMSRRHAGFGFGFLAEDTNFDIPFRLISWSVGDTYARALLVCVLNTLLVSAMSIVASTLLGLLVGIMRLSTNWLVRNIALGFIELVRNTPQLVQIIFWYVAVLQTLPGPRQSILLPAGVLLNVRGVYLPSFLANDFATTLWPLALVVSLAVPFVWRLPFRGLPLGSKSLLLLPLAVLMLVVGIDHTDWPVLRGFNIAGGVQVVPELVALWAGLSIYAAAFIAEIVRAAILSVHKGQREAALSLGLRPRQVLSKIILPQALRVMVPPTTSQYLNIIKSSSLGAAVAYPELFQIFAGTVLQQTSRETETMAILMAVFLSINLTVSAFMNWYNRRVALVGR